MINKGNLSKQTGVWLFHLKVFCTFLWSLQLSHWLGIHGGIRVSQCSHFCVPHLRNRFLLYVLFVCLFFPIILTATAFREWVSECSLAVCLQWCTRASLSPPTYWSHHKAIWPLPLHQWQATIRAGFPNKIICREGELCHDLFAVGWAKRKTEGPIFKSLLPVSNLSRTSLDRRKK